jgi:replicative superfamily II helicase
MQKVSWIDHVKNGEVSQSVKEERNILHTIKRTANWIGHILRRNCLLKHIIEGKIEARLEVRGEDQEEDVSSYWMTTRKGEYTGN